MFLTLIYLTFISLGLPDVLLGTAWPDMHLEFGVALGAAGPVSMMISGTTILAGLMSGSLIRKFGTGRLVAISTLLTGLAMLGYAIAPSYFWLLPLSIPYGLGGGAIDTAVNDYVAEHYSAKHMNWLHAMWGLGAMLGPVILSLTIDTQGWRSGYLWVGVIQLLLTVVLFITIPAWNKRAGIPKGAVSGGPVVKSTLLDALRVPGVPLTIGAFVLYCAAETSLSLWGASYLTELRGMDTASAATWVSVYFGGITLGRILSGFLSMKLKSEQLLRLGGAISVLGAVMILLPLPPVVCAVGMMLFGLGLGPLFPIMLHLTPQRFGSDHSARIIGLQISGAYVGSTFVPPLVGWIAGFTSLQVLPYVLLLCMAVMLTFSSLIDRRGRATS